MGGLRSPLAQYSDIPAGSSSGISEAPFEEDKLGSGSGGRSYLSEVLRFSFTLYFGFMGYQRSVEQRQACRW